MTGENYLKKSEPQEKELEVPAQVGRLQLATKMLEENIRLLEERLAPVLAERKVDGSGTSSAPEPVRVPLAEQLHGVELAFRCMEDRVGSIVSRLEI